MSHQRSELRPEAVSYTERVVAFLDVLAFTALIRKASNHAQAAATICLLDNALRHRDLPESRPHARLRMFSDCICLSDDASPEGVHFVLWRCVVIQGLLLGSRQLVRGAVTLGRHYENESMIFSEGLVQSYELEKSAVYPRVILSPHVVSLAQNQASSDVTGSPVRELILSDFDGLPFLDYFRFLEILMDMQSRQPAAYESRDLSHPEEEETAMSPQEFLERHSQVVQQGLQEWAGEPHVLQKYAWMATLERRADRYGG